MSHCTCIISLLVILTLSNGQKFGDVDRETALQNMFFKRYNRYSKPVLNITTSVPFGMELVLFGIEKVDEKSQTFSSVILLFYNWRDEYLCWNTSEYETRYLRVPAKQIWVPSICTANELAGKRCMTYESVKENEALIHYTGLVTLYHPTKSTIQCKINLRKYPFDEQECTFEFKSVFASIYQLEMNEDYSLVDTSYGTYSGEWSMVSTEKKIQSRQDENNQSLDYALDFTIKIRRRPTIAILMYPQNDEYEREVDISGYRLKTSTEGTRKPNPAVGSEEPTTIKTRSNKDLALTMENVFIVCIIRINFVSLCLLFANIL
ncbi:neuronal acetylcholine receptor subunit beta-4-like [Ostrea edulis]|uniref:neuronal acetylcholine receptor subunit beta-4-like n=1 Tax=Ostrea edulis TaxID=37623 RepID=UPI0024AF4DFC|nr:neuronal acetylcholine receptor subunit beta-4-like [Ostrea edulis]